MKIIIQTNNIYRIKLLPVFTSLFLLFSLQGKGQDYNNLSYIPKPPEAASLSKYIDIPPGTYTGVSSFTIPLYTIEEQDLQIPIYLGYHASGIKVNEIANRAGLGWNLNIGELSLSKQTIGLNDKCRLPIVKEGKFNPNDLHDITSQNIARLALSEIDPCDTQPDIYTYNINGTSGKFIFDSSGNTQLFPYTSIKIKHSDQTSFTFTDSKGIQYIFTPNGATLTYGTEKQKTDINNWSISEILFPNNKKITFEYKKVEYEYIQNILHEFSVYTEENIPDDFIPPVTRNASCDFQPVENKRLNKVKIIENVITKILLPDNSQVEFKYSDDKAIKEYRQDVTGKDVFLDQIIVKNSSGKIIRNYSAIMDYFRSNTQESSHLTSGLLISTEDINALYKRLTLKKLINNLDNSTYILEYYENHTLPHRLSYAKDYWGFYNGKVFNTTDIPKTHVKIKNNIKIYGNADKTPDIEYSLSNSLKKIIYPSGGYSQIEYEADNYFFDGIETSYEYKYIPLNESSLDQLYKFYLPENAISQVLEFSTEPAYVPPHILAPIGPIDPNLPKGYHYCVRAEILDMSGKVVFSLGHFDPAEIDLPKGQFYYLRLKKLAKINENPISQVTFSWYNEIETSFTGNKKTGGLRTKRIESVSDTKNKIIKEYDYVNPKNGFSSGINFGDETIPYYYKFTLPNPGSYTVGGIANEYTNGYCKKTFLTNMKGLDLSTENGKSTGYEYVKEIFKNTENPSEDFSVQQKFSARGDNTFDPLQIPLTPRGSRKHLRGIVTESSSFDSENRLKQKKVFQYNFEEYHFNQFSKNFEYPETIAHPVAIVLQSKEPLIITSSGITYRNVYAYNFYNIYSSWIKLLKEQTTEYFYQGHQADSLTTVKNYAYSSDYKHIQPVQTQITTSTGGELITNYQYPPDINGNPLMQELTSQNRISTPVTTEVLRKEDGREKQISFTETHYAQDATTSNLILPKYIYTKKGEAILEKKITYDKYDNKGNLLQYTLESGIPVSIIWGYNQQHPIAKIEGASYSEIESYVINLQNLSNNSDEQGLLSAYTSLRNKLPLAMITTYTYLPLIGVSTITPPNGLTEYYTYDDAGRLKEIKNQDGQLLKSYEYHYISQN